MPWLFKVGYSNYFLLFSCFLLTLVFIARLVIFVTGLTPGGSPLSTSLFKDGKASPVDYSRYVKRYARLVHFHLRPKLYFQIVCVCMCVMCCRGLSYYGGDDDGF